MARRGARTTRERLTTAAESALERELAATILRGGAKPKIRTLDAGDALTTQGEAATDVYVVIDGLFAVEVDGEDVAEIGPGAVVGERAALEGGVRTATLRATTRARVARSIPRRSGSSSRCRRRAVELGQLRARASPAASPTADARQSVRVTLVR